MRYINMYKNNKYINVFELAEFCRVFFLQIHFD